MSAKLGKKHSGSAPRNALNCLTKEKSMISKKEEVRKEGLLIQFYGEECPHCAVMKPLVEKLERELGIKIEKYEVWHNQANAQRME